MGNLLLLQERLIKKLGENAHPFYFELPPHCPASVTLQPAPGALTQMSLHILQGPLDKTVLKEGEKLNYSCDIGCNWLCMASV